MHANKHTASGIFMAIVVTFGMLCLVTPSLIFLATSFSFIIGISIKVWMFPLFVFLSLILTFFVAKESDSGIVGFSYLLSVVLFTGVTVWGIWHMSQVFDTSYDGLWYHQEAILHFKNGWNPFYQMLPEQVSGSFPGAFYDNHYPKGPWMVSGVVYSTTGYMEMAKVVNLWWMCGIFGIAFYLFCLLTQVPLWAAIVLAIVIGANPVSLSQFYTFYVDGQMGSAIMGLILLLTLWQITGGRGFLWLALLVFVYLANTKFTGLVYGCVVLAISLLYLFWKHRSKVLATTLLFGLTGCLAVVVTGYPTYVTNLIHNHHPFYPIMGPGAEGEAIAQVPRPADFEEKNRFYKYWRANFAEPMWCRAPLETRPKKLFSKINDWYYFSRADFEISGFGPYYAEIFVGLLLGLVLLVLLPIKFKAELFIILVTIITSAFMNSEVWYARYVPHLWLAGVIICVGLMGYKYTRFAGGVLILAMLGNVVLLGYYNLPTHVWESKEARKQFELLKGLPYKPTIRLGWQKTFAPKAAEMGLDYKEADSTIREEDFGAFCGYKRGEWGMFKLSEMQEARELVVNP